MHYAVIGNGIAGTTAALRIRQRDPSAIITLISGESDYCFSRTGLMYAFLDKLRPRDLEPFERKVYDVQRIVRRRGWVKDLDAERQILKFRCGEAMAYDRLLLAVGSAPARIPRLKIANVKSGLVHFVSLQDLETCERITPSTQSAVLVGGGLIGIELAECLVHHGVRVEFLVREPWYWPIALDLREGELVANHIRSRGVNLRLEEEVTIVDVDHAGRVSGVMTDRGFPISCQMLGVCVGVRPAVGWLRNVATPPEIQSGILTDNSFHTSLPNVWAAGDCAEVKLPDGTYTVEQIWYAAKRQGELAADAMVGDVVRYLPPLFYNSAKFFDLEYTTVGTVNLREEGVRSFGYRDPRRPLSVRFAEKYDRMVGFNGIGSRWNHTVIEQWIHDRMPIRAVAGRLHEAQFDAEFGRYSLADLRESFRRWDVVFPRNEAITVRGLV